MAVERSRVKPIRTVGVVLLLAAGVSIGARAEEENGTTVESCFLEELEKQKYSEAKAPATAPVFRWDFSNREVHSYTFEQEVRQKFDVGHGFGEEVRDMEQSVSAAGSLLVKSQGDGTANLVLKDVKISATADFGKEEEPESMEHTMPPVVVQGMEEDGSGAFGCSSQDVLLQMLFPLPTRPLKVGQWVDVPARMPFNVWGSLLEVEGCSRITLTRYVRMAKRTCAQLDVDIDISDLDVPAEIEGEYEFSTKGASVFYFDVEERRFVSGTIAVLMHMSVDAPMPKMDIRGEEMPDMPERQEVEMTSDNLIKVSLRE